MQLYQTSVPTLLDTRQALSPEGSPNQKHPPLKTDKERGTNPLF